MRAMLPRCLDCVRPVEKRGSSRCRKCRLAYRRLGHGNPAYKRNRLYVLENSPKVCGICGGGERGDEDPWTVDHIVPRALGGSHRLGNLQRAHRSCNSRKGDRLL